VKRLIWVALVTMMVLSAGAGALAPTEAASPPPVIAKYYVWYDQNSWDPNVLSDMPVDQYNSYERSTIERHVQQAKSVGIDAFALNWLGPANPTDTNLQTLLSVASPAGFSTAIDFDMNSPFINSAADVVTNLNYASRYFADKAWFRYDGRPVVFFYGIRRYDPGTWAAIRDQVDPGHSAVWIGEGDNFSYLAVFDGIHPYSIAWAPNPAGQLASYASRTRQTPGRLWVATVMPGYDDTHCGRGAAGFARARGDGTFYRQTWEGAMATQPAMISITSWNEWVEGSTIEPSQGYGDLYLRLTKEYSAMYKSGAPVPAAEPGAGE
jgi:hypothetical protein